MYPEGMPQSLCRCMRAGHYPRRLHHGFDELPSAHAAPPPQPMFARAFLFAGQPLKLAQQP